MIISCVSKHFWMFPVKNMVQKFHPKKGEINPPHSPCLGLSSKKNTPSLLNRQTSPSLSSSYSSSHRSLSPSRLRQQGCSPSDLPPWLSSSTPPQAAPRVGRTPPSRPGEVNSGNESRPVSQRVRIIY